MTPVQLRTIGEHRHGRFWISKLAAETGYAKSRLFQIVRENLVVPRRLEREVGRLAVQKPGEGA
jgi:hypothetical protein